MYRRKKWKSAIASLLFLLTIPAFIAGMGRMNRADAAALKEETVNVRIVGTTDLHGQLNSKDYEKGVDYNNGGLARVYDLITKARKELPRENTITLDAGDVLFDYTTEYIFSENQRSLQPIYKAMSLIGYDAITLGNHDFDYGYDYILRQLEASSLKDKTIVSNVTDSKTGEYPFHENMLLRKKMKTSAGKEVEVKIGIIGLTIPTLTAKTHSYAGILKTEDMVTNARTQAAKLKEMGADIIIALSHTGIGPENPELNFKNVAYALTKIPEIDVVVCGHEHNLFPTDDMTSPYYKLPGVDKKTYLINGKNVVMAGSRGEAIGVVDLTLKPYGDSFVITNRSSEIRKVTADNTVEDKVIASLFESWDEEMLHYTTDVIGELKKDAVIQNYFGLLGDNTAIQLLNDSKMQYALRLINTAGKQYLNYPIIAASSYASFGANSIDDYVSITERITESKLSEIQPYNNYLYLYTITGKQLKEWLEWSASAYETLYTDEKWTDATVSELMKEHNLKYLVREEWMKDWSSFYIFDGIDYVINPSEKPRYDFSGNKINSTNRVVSVKYNGQVVTDDMVLILATDKITKPVDANKGVENQVVLNGFTRSQSVLSKYITVISRGGSIDIPVDYNWRVSFPKGYQFMIRAPYYADSLIKSTPWYKKELVKGDQYNYYAASYPVEDGDITGPDIIISPLVTSATKSRFDVAVHVSDASEIKQIRYTTTENGIDYGGWPTAKSITQNGTFTVYKNGTYSVYAEDIHGNKSVKNIVIDNFNDNLLSMPVVDTYTNRKTKISGTAEPNTNIIFLTDTGTYESTVGISGKFSYPLPAQQSGSMVYVYVVNEEKGLVSEQASVPVKRTGPNQPSIRQLYNDSDIISGNSNDKDASVIVIAGDIVYVPEDGGRSLYEANTEIYDKSLKVVEVPFILLDNGYFFMTLPPQEAGKTIKVYNIDHLSRNSRVVSLTVEGDVPNAPVVYEVSNIEKSLRGYIPDSSGKSFEVTMETANQIYKVKTDSKGGFFFEIPEQLQAGQILSVSASDAGSNNGRSSYKTKVTVRNIEDYIREGSGNLVLDKVTNKSYMIAGNYYDGGTVYIAIGSKTGEVFANSLYSLTTDESFRFIYDLEENLEPGTIIYAMARFSDGGILRASKTIVLQGRPDMPGLVREITNSDKKVDVIAQKDCEIVLTIGSKKYSTKEYRYDEENDRYIYSLDTDRDVSGTPVTIKASNAAGTGNEFKTVIIKTAPDAPKVNQVKAGDKSITGMTEPGAEIFAKIGSKTYKGKVDDNGKFSITVPALKKGAAIRVWGSSQAGRGPLTYFIVPAK